MAKVNQLIPKLTLRIPQDLLKKNKYKSINVVFYKHTIKNKDKYGNVAVDEKGYRFDVKIHGEYIEPAKYDYKETLTDIIKLFCQIYNISYPDLNNYLIQNKLLKE